MNTRDELNTWLTEIGQDPYALSRVAEVLDVMVQEVKAAEASAINNDGIPAQVEFLLGLGVVDATPLWRDLRDALADDDDDEEPSPRRCFYVPADAYVEGKGFVPSLVIEGEAGHAPLSGNGDFAQPYYWGSTYDEATAHAAAENARIGLTPDDVTDIILSSMRASGFADAPANTKEGAE